MFPPSQLPAPSQLILISDSLASPADFLVYHLIFERLRAVPPKRCVYLGASLDTNRLAAVGTKAGVNTSRSIQDSTLVVDDFLPDLDRTDDGSFALRSVYKRLQGHFVGENSVSPSLVIVDDLASLSWMDFSALELSRFARALCALTRQHQASLVIRHHCVTPDDPDELLQHLQQLSTYHLEVRPLASGRSGSVSGDIAVHAGPSVEEPIIRLRPRKEAIQYRLTDNGARYFERGTGEIIL